MRGYVREEKLLSIYFFMSAPHGAKLSMETNHLGGQSLRIAPCIAAYWALFASPRQETDDDVVFFVGRISSWL